MLLPTSKLSPPRIPTSWVTVTATDDARQRCLLEAKRKILEQAGVYIESASEVKNFDLTKDKIASFAAAVMHITETKDEVGFQQGR